MNILFFFKYWRAKRLINSLTRSKTESKRKKNLTILFQLFDQIDLPFPIDNPAIISTLLALKDWEIGEEFEKRLNSLVEYYLIPLDPTNSPIFSKWLQEKQRKNEIVDVLNINISQAIKELIENGLSSEKKSALEFLLTCYLSEYQKIVPEIQKTENNINKEILCNYYSLLRLTGTKAQQDNFRQTLIQNFRFSPKSLIRNDINELLNSSSIGVSSPNCVNITFYHQTNPDKLIKVVSSGVTPDPVINSKVFSVLYAFAMSGNIESTFVFFEGANIITQEKDFDDSTTSSKLLKSVIGPISLAEPKSDIPSLAMSLKESMLLVSDTLEELKSETGLVNVNKWHIRDSINLDEKVREIIRSNFENGYKLENSPGSNEPQGVIDIIPVYSKNSFGEVIPVEITIPAHVINYDKVNSLLRSVRASQMGKLIEAGERRKFFAFNAYSTQDQAVKAWKAKSHQDKILYCQKNPFVITTQYYDFELAMNVKLSEPKQIDTFSYEENHRPSIRDTAQKFYKEFERLCEKLEEINEIGGPADLLSFKYLFNSMIRRNPFWENDDKFRNNYERWSNNTSPIIWAIFQNWAIENKYPIEKLFDDNILFDSEIRTNGEIVIKPKVVLDLNDFILYLDANSPNRIIKVYKGEKSKTLNEMFHEKSSFKINNVPELFKSFKTWVKQNYSLENRNEEQKLLKEKLLNIYDDSDKLKTLMQLEISKKHVIRGNSKTAVEIIEKIKKSDYSCIYLWGALAYQQEYIKKNYFFLYKKKFDFTIEEFEDKLFGITYDCILKELRKFAKTQRRRLDSLHDSLFLGDFDDVKNEVSSYFRNYESQSLFNLPIDENAKVYIDQLMSKNQANGFVSNLIEDGQYNLLEEQEFKVNKDEKIKLQNALLAISSIELLSLAETMNKIAEDMSFDTYSPVKLKDRLLDQVFSKIDDFSGDPPMNESQMKELLKFL